jgi:hypothetical protein
MAAKADGGTYLHHSDGDAFVGVSPLKSGGEWQRATKCGCLSRKMAVIDGVAGVAFGALMGLLLGFRVGPSPNWALLLLWPALSHLHMALLFALDVEAGSRWLGKVPNGYGAAFTKFPGTPIPGAGAFDAPVVADDLGGRSRPGSHRHGDDFVQHHISRKRPNILCCGGCWGVCGCCCVRSCYCCSCARSDHDVPPASRAKGAAWVSGIGSMWLPATVWFLPPLLSQWSIWFLRHTLMLPWDGERPYDRVGIGIYVGRYPIRFPSEFPANIASVVDMTAEFPARPDVVQGRRYAVVPALDCTMPDPRALIAAAVEVNTWTGPVYVHCANGHGRSSCFAALLMLQRGEAASWREAFAMMARVRPWVSLHDNQAKLMDFVEQEMRRLGYVAPSKSSDVAAAGEVELASLSVSE